ncbi:hypothetical protein KAF25_010999 [Fusarium avenaceum]|uniref:Uncharacterized protein n=1 Tax=Fusarium avenaceum TaxID=40199 RepID=A0A9P7GUS9_9HYPO|nr:hypothetical protein KAF25_010999 [Fusarium avenaceum]
MAAQTTNFVAPVLGNLDGIINLERANDFYLIGHVSHGEETDKLGAGQQKTLDQKGDVLELPVTFSVEYVLG